MQVPQNLGPSVELNPLAGQRLAPFAEVRQGPAGIISRTMDAFSAVEEKRDQAQVEAAVNQASGLKSQLTSDYGTQLGANVVQPKDGQPFGQVYLGKFDDGVKGIEESLANDRQKTLFRQRVGLVRTVYQAGLDDHIIKQTKSFGVDTDNATIEGCRRDAAQSPTDEKTRSLAWARTSAAVNSMAQDLGWGEQEIKNAQVKAAGAFHGAVIGGALDQKNFGFAKQYLDAHEKEMDPAKVAEIRKVISQTGDAIQQEKDFEQIRDSGQSLEAQLREAEKRYAGNPEGLKAVKSDLVSWHGQLKASQTAEQQTLSGKVQEMYRPTLPGGKAMSVTAIKQTPEWGQLEPKERQDLLDYWDRLSKGNDPDNDPTTALIRFGTYMKILDDPKGLVGMSDGQIAGLNRVLGPRLTMKLMEDKRQAAGDLGKLANVTLGDLPWRDIAGEYGIKAKGTLNPQQNAVLGQLYDEATDRIRTLQKAKGKPLNQEEKEAEFRSLLQRAPEKRGWYNPARWVGDTYTPEGKFLFQLQTLDDVQGTPEEKTTAVSALIQANLRSADPRPQEEVLTPANVQMLINAKRQPKP